MSDILAFRLAADGRAATWNPALTRASHVLVQVQLVGGDVEIRRSLNSGRVRVREGERIIEVAPADGE